MFDKPITCPVLIGRQLELDALHAQIDLAAQGQGQVVLSSGEAGIGKSRLALHRTVAEAMEALYAPALDARLADLAAHFYAAGAWGQALAYAQRAGERAQALYAPRVAAEQFTMALHAAHHLAMAPPARLYRLRGQAHETTGEFELAQGDYERAYAAAADARESANGGQLQWQLLIDLGFLWAGRDYARAGSYFRQAVALAPPPPELQQLFAALQHNQAQTDRFFGAVAGTVPIPGFFAPQNIGQIMGAAELAQP